LTPDDTPTLLETAGRGPSKIFRETFGIQGIPYNDLLREDGLGGGGGGSPFEGYGKETPPTLHHIIFHNVYAPKGGQGEEG
jgi:hypothetical protein